MDARHRQRDQPRARVGPVFGHDQRAAVGALDPPARLLVVGLAPAAHGANRTGRMFTGDRSGDFLYAALLTELKSDYDRLIRAVAAVENALRQARTSGSVDRPGHSGTVNSPRPEVAFHPSGTLSVTTYVPPGRTLTVSPSLTVSAVVVPSTL